jgi:hypothetical protein
MTTWRNLALYLLLLMGLSFGTVYAQEATEVPTETPTPPALSVTTAEPTQHTVGTAGTLSVTGANFTANTVVRLVGFGFLTTTVLNANALTATLPAGLPVGVYDVEVSDPNRGTATLAARLRVLSPALPLEPTNTPVPIPMGQPFLVLRNFSVSPTTASVGQAVRVTFEVVNQGSAAAFGVSVAVESGAFVPSGGQASVTLPDIFPNGATSASITAVVATSATAGANTIPLVMTYRDGEGKSYSGKGTVGVEVTATVDMPQVTLLSYITTPATAKAGELVVISAQIRNSGTKTASQALLRMSGDGRTLLAGPRGDTFPLGDIAPNSVVNVELPMIVSAEAKAGPQPQAFVLSYMVDGKAIEAASSLTVQVSAIAQKRPLLLLESVSYGASHVAPGERFTLVFTIRNVGDANADALLVTFGTVEVTPPSGGGDGGSSGGGGGTARGNTSGFAPLGTGGTTYEDSLAPEGALIVEQEFIANATLTSGIYNLPITAQHRKADGTTATDTFNASVVVVAPPRLQTRVDVPPPPFANTFEPFPMAITLVNRGKNVVNLTHFAITGEGVEVLDGVETPLAPLKPEEEVTLNGLVMPVMDGTWRTTLTLFYTDELNQPQSITFNYEGEAMTVDVPPFPEEPIEPTPTPKPPPPTVQDVVGRLLLGFLGLGE